ncbi:MAG: peptidoglycan-binding protein [Clostridia bacterium]|nr:peptidoglycan-binding protein [Clostridia bacterium]
MASTYTELRKGATGNNVSAMQTALNNAGFSVNASGSFDDATEAALKQYQQQNGLTVDGIAGDQTLSKLYGTGTATDTTGYTPSAAVTQAQKYLESVQANKPGSYQSKYTDQMDDLLNQITARGPFSYDPTNDPLYNIYKDRYIMNGQRAMQDTMGQAAALTGGYGNSYAQIAGQQQYNQYMEGLNDIVPELEQRAYQRYADEGDRLINNYNLLGTADDRDYSRNMDDYNKWLTEDQRAQQAYLDYYDRDYQQFTGDREQGNIDREYANSLAMQIIQTGQMPSAELLRAAGLSPEDAALLMEYYKPKGSGSGGSGGQNKNKDNTAATPYNSAVGTMIRNNLKTLSGGKAMDLLTPRQWSGVDPVAVPASINNGKTTSMVVNPLAQSMIDTAKTKPGAAANALNYSMNNYTDYAVDAIAKAYNSGQVTGAQAVQLLNQVKNNVVPQTVPKTTTTTKDKNKK